MDSKKVIIIGKQACEGISAEKKERIRVGLEKQKELTIEQAMSSLLSLGTHHEEKYSRTFRTELEKKINGYKQQDIRKNLHDTATLISFKDTVNKLVLCGLKCHYCEERVKVLYRKVRDKYQWTLDRIDNDKNHSCENTVISCLSCNLSRRRRTKEAYEFHWKTKIVKVDKTVEVEIDDESSDSDEVESD